MSTSKNVIPAQAGIQNTLNLTAIGVAEATRLDNELEHLGSWLKDGLNGQMAFLAKGPQRRCDPREVMPSCKSVIVCLMRYADMPTRMSFPRKRESHGCTEDPRLRGDDSVPKYLRHEDYHEIMGEKLEAVAADIRGAFPEAECRCYCDTGPVLEKAWAVKAGLGFIGKNTLFIHPQYGSQLAIGVILCSVDGEKISPSPLRERAGVRESHNCGSCSACIKACPTGALVAPCRLDATKCISYKFFIAKKDGGCDICQSACKFNRKEPL
jgi:epoxyqueuosine reductase